MKTATLREGIDYRVAGRLFVRGVPQSVDDELGAYLAGVPAFEVMKQQAATEQADRAAGQRTDEPAPEEAKPQQSAEPAAREIAEAEQAEAPTVEQRSKKRKR